MAYYGNYDSSSGNSNNSKEPFVPNYYAGVRLTDGEGKHIVKLSYWKAMIKISIFSVANTPDEKSKELEHLMLSAYKTYILSKQIDAVLKSDKPIALGINTGNKQDEQNVMIVGKKGDKTNPIYYLTIGVTDTNGCIKHHETVVFPNHDAKRSNYGYTVDSPQIDNGKAFDFKVAYYDQTPMAILKYAFEDFTRAATGASGAVSTFITRWDADHLSNNLYRIMKKMGIPMGNSYNQNYNKSESAAGQWFANGGKSPSSDEDFGMNVPASDDDFGDLESSID